MVAQEHRRERRAEAQLRSLMQPVRTAALLAAALDLDERWSSREYGDPLEVYPRYHSWLGVQINRRMAGFAATLREVVSHGG